jgi:hypothetical protein
MTSKGKRHKELESEEHSSGHGVEDTSARDREQAYSECFTGQVSFDSWLEYQRLIRDKELDARTLVRKVGGDALKFLLEYHTHRIGDRDYIMSVLRAKYPKQRPHVHTKINQLVRLQQQEGESVDRYNLRFNDLSYELTTAQDGLQLILSHIFLSGLRKPIRKRLVVDEDKLSDSVAIYELALKIETNMQVFEDDIICYRCHQPGHKSLDCTAGRDGQQQQQQENGKQEGSKQGGMAYKSGPGAKSGGQ